MQTSSKIIDRVIKHKNFKTDAKLAEYWNISPTTVATWRKRDTIPFKKIIAFCEVENVSLDYILLGKGEIIQEGMESGSGTYKVGDPLDENPEIAGLLDMTREVFKSGTGYSETLIANIRLFHHAMKTEKRFEERLGKIEKKEKSRKKNPPRIREGDNEAERDTILEKRMVCVG